MNAVDMQYEIDRKGYLKIPSGTHTIDTPIILGRSSRDVVIEGHPTGYLEASGLSDTAIFEYDHPGTYNAPSISFYGVNFEGTTSSDRVGCFKVKNSGTAPKRLEFEKCKLACSYAYPIDGRAVGQSEGIIIRDCSSAARCGLRWKTSTAGTYVTDFVNVENWRMVNSGRLGPAIDLDSCLGVRLVQVIDDGRPQLTAPLVGVYAGPIAMRINNPGPHCLIDDYWLEPWGDWATDAPNCFGFEFRADDTSSIRRQQVTCRNASLNATGSSGELIRVVGGNTSSSAQPLRVDFEDMFALAASDVLLAGKSYTVSKRTWYIDGGTTYPGWRTKVNDLVSGAFRDNVVTSGVNRPPMSVTISGNTYSGTALDTNYFTTAPDFESLI